MRLSTGLIFAVAIVMGCSVFRIANQYEVTERKLARTESKIQNEQEALRVLQAEWTFLTSPARLEKVSREFLGLQAMNGSQYVVLAAIPMREEPEVLQDDAADAPVIAIAPAMPTVNHTLPALHITPVHAAHTGGVQ